MQQSVDYTVDCVSAEIGIYLSLRGNATVCHTPHQAWIGLNIGPYLLSVGKKIVVMKWQHAEAWISLTTDTADGFELEAEFHIHESPNVMSIIKGPSVIPLMTAATGLFSKIMSTSEVNCAFHRWQDPSVWPDLARFCNLNILLIFLITELILEPWVEELQMIKVHAEPPCC